MEAVHSRVIKDDQQKRKCLIRVVSKVSDHVGNSIKKYERKSVIVRLASIVDFEGTY